MSGLFIRLAGAGIIILIAGCIIMSISEGRDYAFQSEEMIKFYKITGIGTVACAALAFIFRLFEE